jgi:hypothetical protein
MTYQDLITEINGKLCDQETGEPTGLNQFFDYLIQIKESADQVLEDIPTIEDIEDLEKDPMIYIVHSSKLRNLEEKVMVLNATW